jgi:hypothetical protein
MATRLPASVSDAELCSQIKAITIAWRLVDEWWNGMSG